MDIFLFFLSVGCFSLFVNQLGDLCFLSLPSTQRHMRQGHLSPIPRAVARLQTTLCFILRHLSELKTPTVCMATASPAKFPEAVRAAGIEMPMSPQLAQLLTRPTRYKEMKVGEDWDQMLRATIDEISKKRSKPFKFSSA